MAGKEVHLSDKFILVHSHFLVDMNEWPDDEFTLDPAIEWFKVVLRRKWSSTRQVDVSSLYADKPVPASLKTLADYGLKFPIKYYYRFTDSAEENEVVIDGKKHNLARNFEPDVLAQMVTGVAGLSKNALYIRMGKSKAS